MDSGLKTAVIGGGWAGLSAAAELVSQQVPVTLFEASRQLGGRGRGLNWKGRRLDNGQHILLGAYRETLRLLQLAGVDANKALLRLPLQLVQHEQFSLQTSRRLPAPLHMVGGLLRARGLGKRERLAALMLMTKLKLQNFRLERDEPLADFLHRHKQPDRLTRLLWEPLCLAALNTPLRIASTRVFLNVLRDSFSHSRADSDLLLPRLDLGNLFAEPLGQYIRQQGGDIQLNRPVAAIRHEAGGFVLTVGEAEMRFEQVVIAVPPFRLAGLAGDLPQLGEAVQQAAKLDYQPIITVFLQYPEQVQLPFPMLGLSGGHSQWVLDRGALCGDAGLLAVVISAEGPHMDITQEALAGLVAAELAKALPGLPPLLWHKVIAEKRATFTCRPHLQRPAQATPLPGLYLAGDYTEGDYPATLEGAVRSGIKCAKNILARPK